MSHEKTYQLVMTQALKTYGLTVSDWRRKGVPPVEYQRKVSPCFNTPILKDLVPSQVKSSITRNLNKRLPQFFVESPDKVDIVAAYFEGFWSEVVTFFTLYSFYKREQRSLKTSEALGVSFEDMYRFLFVPYDTAEGKAFLAVLFGYLDEGKFLDYIECIFAHLVDDFNKKAEAGFFNQQSDIYHLGCYGYEKGLQTANDLHIALNIVYLEYISSQTT